MDALINQHNPSEPYRPRHANILVKAQRIGSQQVEFSFHGVERTLVERHGGAARGHNLSKDESNP